MFSLNKMLLGTAALAAMSLAMPANAALVIPSGAPGTTGATALYLDSLSEISTSDDTATQAELLSFLGKPDDNYTGIANAWIQFDLGGYRLVNGTGADFTVYEYNSGAVEFSSADILVSLDGSTWYNIENDTATFVDLAGDEVHTAPTFRRSYDIGNALTSLGVSELRYLRLDGTSGAAVINGSNGFDPDAVGFINYTAPQTGAVPEPASWAMMIGGFAIAGAAMRRRTQVAFAA